MGVYTTIANYVIGSGHGESHATVEENVTLFVRLMCNVEISMPSHTTVVGAAYFGPKHVFLRVELLTYGTIGENDISAGVIIMVKDNQDFWLVRLRERMSFRACFERDISLLMLVAPKRLLHP